MTKRKDPDEKANQASWNRVLRRKESHRRRAFAALARKQGSRRAKLERQHHRLDATSETELTLKEGREWRDLDAKLRAQGDEENNAVASKMSISREQARELGLLRDQNLTKSRLIRALRVGDLEILRSDRAFALIQEIRESGSRKKQAALGKAFIALGKAIAGIRRGPAARPRPQLNQRDQAELAEMRRYKTEVQRRLRSLRSQWRRKGADPKTYGKMLKLDLLASLGLSTEQYLPKICDPKMLPKAAAVAIVVSKFHAKRQVVERLGRAPGTTRRPQGTRMGPGPDPTTVQMSKRNLWRADADRGVDLRHDGLIATKKRS